MDEKLTIGSITQLTAQTGPWPIGVPLGGEGAMWMAGEPAREIARLKAEVEALRKDAERYRWLREQHTYDGEGDSDITRWYVKAGREPVPCDPGALDAEIDAAMAACGSVGAA